MSGKDSSVSSGEDSPRTLERSGNNLLRVQSEVLAQISDAVVVVDAEQRVTFWNRAAERLSGLEAKEVLGRKLTDHEQTFCFNPKDREEAAAILADGGVWHGEHIFFAPGGEQVQVETTFSVIKDAHGDRIGTLALIRDVTERRRERQLYGITERRLREALKVGGMGYLDWDLATNKMIWSEETYRMYGVEPSPDGPDIHSTVQMVHPDDKELVQRHLEAVVKGEAEYNIEHRMVRPDGHTITVHAQGEVTRDADGNPIRMLGTVLDITERKLAEEEQRRSHELLQKVLASLEEAVVVVDEKSRLILECNETAERMFGYRRQEMLGRSTRMAHVNDEMFDRYLREMTESVSAVGYYRSEFQFRRKSGEAFPTELFVRPIRYGGGTDIVLAVIRDISNRVRAEEEKKRLEAQLQQAQKMEAIGQLAGGVAHDFNNLLTVINGYASVTLGRILPSDPLHEDISEILQAGQRAAALTQQLLAFSRKQVVRPKPMDLNRVVAENVNMLQRLIGEQIHLRVSLAPAQVCILADPGQIQQVIINLVVNARDAVAEGGCITVETRNVDLSEHEAAKIDWIRPGPHGMLVISDNGTGMTAETRARIFEPFFTTKELGRGTGLGLSTVYGIVRQSNGSIVVESEPDRGAAFMIYLPAAESSIEEPRAPDFRPEALQGTETILLVEDEREVRKLTCTSLTRFGYRVLEAANAGEAFLICEQVSDPIALMITDVVMPGMTGWQLAQRMQKMRPKMKVVYISGYADEELTHRGALQTGVHFVQKPFDPKMLAAKIREILSKP